MNLKKLALVSAVSMGLMGAAIANAVAPVSLTTNNRTPLFSTVSTAVACATGVLGDPKLYTGPEAGHESTSVTWQGLGVTVQSMCLLGFPCKATLYFGNKDNKDKAIHCKSDKAHQITAELTAEGGITFTGLKAIDGYTPTLTANKDGNGAVTLEIS